ncbi:F5/8 type C domain-containing protein [Dysgonomonas alginatilytica]|uniref:F5/8 type C domain-containing protein n=1 Tax=Dysgonomonas alginatilytica TaxID=1605892 RepID=A0A2V3PS21_9BACT|nr:glycosyl hydrolase [Dysgonomonas alginatilytica]PXV64730.1 F5/8 type C domain-containing protein [Dysgonomonas alginatilytica]
MKKILLFCFICWLNLNLSYAQDLRKLWTSPPEKSKSWVFWYWMQGAVSKEGITADIEAMKEIGIAGAYLMPIKGVPEKPFVTPIVEQLSPLWWEMVEFAFKEADRVGVKIGFHICDGFALAGGPWITPELSMQKVVWSKVNVNGGAKINQILPQPESYKGYYKDIAVFAYPTLQGEGISTETVKPKVTANVPDIDPQFLVDKNSTETFRSESPCWIQYAFEKPFTCRTIQVQAPPRSFQVQRLTIEASDDGVNFQKIVQLAPPRQGWQNDDFPMTNSIPTTTARYFRFLYDKSGTEPGSEDLDAAKWKQSLKIKGILLSSEARIHQYEGKSAQVWRMSPRTTNDQITSELCINPKQLIDISQYVDKDGKLNWKAPKGNWTILRMGHTSTGHTNATGGKGAGLECDKFNPEAIRLQFNSWFGKAVEIAGEDLASRVLKVFHVDSWECGSQNWSSNFRDEFKIRRGYDILPYLPVMAGIPIENTENSERILYDVRQTISELVVDKFYAVLKEEANAKGAQFSAECVSPTMMSDGVMHYKNTDLPMGEYWLQSPTHDKPNDVLDAISGGHIYEKNIIQAESFTQLRTMFDEHPAMLKTLQDRHYALGINRLSYHVNVLNPWLDRQPGMTLDGIGLYFQRDQTWWKLGKAWVDYAQRCQALLQFGKPVVDIAVFMGEELPRRAILPDRLVPFLPGIFGEEKVELEKKRLANVGEPTRQMPVGVNHSSNITNSENWVNALRGYHYDSFNPDVLLNSAKVEDGRIVLPNGMSYGALVIPGKHPMQPNPERMSIEVANKIKEFSTKGATILIGDDLPHETLSYKDNSQKIVWGNDNFIRLPYTQETFAPIGIERDFIVTETNSKYAKDVAYTHRQGDGIDIYFVSNQQDFPRQIDISLRVTGRIPELWNPVNGEINTDIDWEMQNNRTNIKLHLDTNESTFIVLQTPTNEKKNQSKLTRISGLKIKSPWQVQFDEKSRGSKERVIFNKLTDWSTHKDDRIRYYSGTAVYINNFNLTLEKSTRYYLQLDEVYNLAEVKINGKSCGTIWTKPYLTEITGAVKDGENTLEISVVNTWANRIMGDEDFDAEKDESKKIWTNARYRMAEKKLVKSGLIGEATILKLK